MSALWPFRHLGLKMLALAFATVMWLIVAGEDTVERGLRVPLQFEQFPAGLELLGEPPTAVDVRVRGAASIVSRMSPGDVVAVVDLHTSAPGRRLFQLTPEQVRAPFGVQVVQVTPATLAMSFERSAIGVVPIVPVVEGTPAPGYVVGAVTLDPQKVEVIGPESVVIQATEALTETITVDGARASVAGSVTIGFLSPELRLRTPQRANVSVEVVRGPRERTVRNRPVQLRNLHQLLTAEAIPSAVEVALRGHESVDRLSPDRIVAFADLTGLGVGRYSLTVQVTAPGDASVVGVTPQVVQVTIAAVRD